MHGCRFGTVVTRWSRNGLTENDGHENDGPSKLQEIAGHEKDGPSSMA